MEWKGIFTRARRWKEEIKESGIGISTEGRRSVLLIGCEELLTYRDDLVRIRTADGTLAVLGEDLTLRAFHGNRILVEGAWRSLTWEDEI